MYPWKAFWNSTRNGTSAGPYINSAQLGVFPPMTVYIDLIWLRYKYLAPCQSVTDRRKYEAAHSRISRQLGIY